MSYVYFACAAFFYACAQIITFGKFKLKGDFWQNWNRKYKQPQEPAPTTWYYKLAVLKYKERFPGSGTILVSFTDGYHLMQLCFKISLSIAIGTYNTSNWLLFSSLYLILFGVIFTITNRLVSK